MGEIIIDIKLDCMICVDGVFRELAATPSKIEKEKILSVYKENKLFKKCLKFLLDPYVTTGISKKKISKKINLSYGTEVDTLEELMDYIEKNNTGTDKDIATVKLFISKNGQLEDFISGLMTKSIKLGLTSKTANKVFEGLIKEFNVMLAESYDKNTKRVEGKEFILTTKLDGIRLISLVENNTVKFYSRQGQIVEGLIDIEKEMTKLPDGVYDGELIAIGDFTDSKEQFAATMKRGRVKGAKRGLKFVAYDYIENINDFYSGIDHTPCIDRKNSLNHIIEENLTNSDFVEYLYPLYCGTDTDAIQEFSKMLTEEGEEGIMLSIVDSPYSCKRSKDLLKVKVFKTCDIKCLDIEKGEGKYNQTLGSIKCKYKNNELSVGSGFTDDQRKFYYENPKEIIGKIVQVKYFEELITEGRYSLRFPIFELVREDGKEVSYE